MAKKRYHQSAKDRLDESRGMEREIRRKDVKKAFKRGERDERDYHMDPRRRRHLESEGMLHEDHNEIANLPQHVMMKPYPKTDYYSYDLNDDIRDIDVQMDDDVRKERRKAGMAYPEKY